MNEALMALPVESRRAAISIANTELEIKQEKEYLASDSIRHPRNDARTNQRIYNLELYLIQLREWHMDVTGDAIEEARAFVRGRL